jgi:hypothetical protein
MNTDISEYIKDRLKHQQNWYEDKASMNKRRFMNYHTLIIILGSLIPLIVVFEGFVTWNILKATTSSAGFTLTSGHYSAVIAATIAILAGIDKLTQPQVNWFNYRANEEMLKKEEWMYKFKTGNYVGLNDKEAEKLLVNRVESIISADIARFTNSEYKAESEDAGNNHESTNGTPNTPQ